MRNSNLDDTFQSPSNPFENQENFNFDQGGMNFQNNGAPPPNNGTNGRGPDSRKPRGSMQPNIAQNMNGGNRIKESVTLNEVLLAPISSLYAFTIKIHSGFRLDEEVKVLASTQTAYLVMGLITGSKVYLIMSLGNILSILVVLILASSYINLPDYLSPDGILNRRNKNEEYEEALRNYNENMDDGNQQYTNTNYNRNNVQNFNGNKNNIRQVDPNYNDAYIRENNNPNMGNNMYNKLSDNTPSFNNFGLTTVDRPDDGINFGISNLSEKSANINPTKEFNSNNFTDKSEDMVNFRNMLNNTSQTEFSPTYNQPFRNPNGTRDQIFEQSPYRNRIITENNKREVFGSISPTENRDYRRNPRHRAANNVMDMIKDGFASSLSNSSIYQQDKEDFMYAE